MSAVLSEHKQFLSASGKPLAGGSVYIGVIDSDPVAVPKTIYSDRGLTVVLANPQILDANGRATNKIWVNGTYSMQVNDITGSQVFQDLDRGETTTDIGLVGLTGVTGGNTITAGSTPVITAYVDQSLYSFKAVQTNTGATTLNIDGVGAKAIVQNNDLALGSGKIKTDDNVIVVYNSTNDNFAIANQKTNFTGYRAVSSADTVDPGDLGFLIDCTAALTLSITSSATLGEGFSFTVKAKGGDVTIDPDGAQTINGVASLVIVGGRSTKITCDGANFHTTTAATGSVGYRTISGAGTIVEADRGVLIDCTDTLALALTSVATLGSGFFFYMKANGGSVGIDPDGTETIDGLTTKFIGDGTSLMIMTDGTNWFSVVTGIKPKHGELFGLTISNDAIDAAKDIDIAVGSASSDDVALADVEYMLLETAIVKQMDASWAVGTNSGGLDTGTIAGDTWYHLFIIARSDTGIVDVLVSLSPTAPTMPTGYDKKRRIGSILTDATPDILGFTQRGDEFLWDASVKDIDGQAASSSAASVTLSVPLGLKTLWKGSAALLDVSPTNATQLLVSALDQDDQDPTTISNVSCSGSGGSALGISQMQIRTNVSSQVRVRTSSTLDRTISLTTFGWIDSRGAKNA